MSNFPNMFGFGKHEKAETALCCSSLIGVLASTSGRPVGCQSATNSSEPGSVAGADELSSWKSDLCCTRGVGKPTADSNDGKKSDHQLGTLKKTHPFPT